MRTSTPEIFLRCIASLAPTSVSELVSYNILKNKRLTYKSSEVAYSTLLVAIRISKLPKLLEIFSVQAGPVGPTGARWYCAVKGQYISYIILIIHPHQINISHTSLLI